MATIPTIVMLGPPGETTAEQWLSTGRWAACRDLLARLNKSECYHPIYGLFADRDQREYLISSGGVALSQAGIEFHFATEFINIIKQLNLQNVAYFGGASAPLLQETPLQEMALEVLEAKHPVAWVNNFHSTDWAIFNQAEGIIPFESSLIHDNALGWVLKNMANYCVHSMSPSAISRVDIDTPMDVAMLLGHPQVGPALKTLHENMDSALRIRVQRVREIMATPAANLMLAGRVPAYVLQAIGQQTQLWTRVFSEERGMLASGRLQRGEVQSVFALLVQTIGITAALQYFAGITDALLWDTRVWMAHRGHWPSTAERFALDLGWMEALEDSNLIDLAQAIEDVNIPVLSGGFGVVSGGVFALLDSIGEK